MHKAVSFNSNFTNNHNYHPFLLLKLSCGKKLQGKVALAKTGIMENLKKKNCYTEITGKHQHMLILTGHQFLMPVHAQPRDLLHVHAELLKLSPHLSNKQNWIKINNQKRIKIDSDHVNDCMVFPQNMHTAHSTIFQ